MAVYTTTDRVGQRESLSNLISRIDPADTPVYSNAKKGTSKAILEEHLVQELVAASASNWVAEGADPSYAAPEPMKRLANSHGIKQKDVMVSGSLEAVSKAGAASEMAYQKGLKALELRRDIDACLLVDNAKVTSGTRETGSLTSAIMNGSVAGDGELGPDIFDDVYAEVPTAGTARPLTLAMIEDAHQAAYIDGGNPSMMVLSPAKKRAFSDLADTDQGVVANQYNQTSPKEATLVGATSIYLTDFGQLQTVIDRQCPDDRVFLLDPQHYEIRTLPGRNFHQSDIAPTGDAKKMQLITEFVLCVTAPKAHAVILDLS